MKSNQTKILILNGVFVFSILMIIIDTKTSFDIKNQIINSLIYLGILVLTPVVLICNIWIFKTRKWNIIRVLIPVIILVGTFIIGPLVFLNAASTWKTQTVLYQNTVFSNKKIEFQMKDIGAFGYNRRTVEVLYVTNLFMIVNPVEKDIDKNKEWEKVDLNINELELKYP